MKKSDVAEWLEFVGACEPGKEWFALQSGTVKQIHQRADRSFQRFLYIELGISRKVDEYPEWSIVRECLLREIQIMRETSEQLRVRLWREKVLRYGYNPDKLREFKWWEISLPQFGHDDNSNDDTPDLYLTLCIRPEGKVMKTDG